MTFRHMKEALWHLPELTGDDKELELFVLGQWYPNCVCEPGGIFTSCIEIPRLLDIVETKN